MDKMAVALKYTPEENNAPFVIAKGSNKTAELIVEKAQKAGIPVVSSPEIIHDLFALDILQEIPTSLYKAVAEILVFIGVL